MCNWLKRGISVNKLWVGRKSTADRWCLVGDSAGHWRESIMMKWRQIEQTVDCSLVSVWFPLLDWCTGGGCFGGLINKWSRYSAEEGKRGREREVCPLLLIILAWRLISLITRYRRYLASIGHRETPSSHSVCFGVCDLCLTGADGYKSPVRHPLCRTGVGAVGSRSTGRQSSCLAIWGSAGALAPVAPLLMRGTWQQNSQRGDTLTKLREGHFNWLSTERANSQL